MTFPVSRILSVLLVICFLSAPLPLRAAEGMETVRIGYYEDGDYMSRNQAGEYVGFNFEYMQEIAKFSGLRYNIVDGVSWENTLDMLEKCEIDILPAVYYTPERAKKMLFSELPMLSLFTTLNVRQNDQRYTYEDFPSFQGMKVGIIANSKDGEKFRQYCRDNNLDLTIIPYAETGTLLAALADKTLDGVAITHLGRNSVFRSVAQFSAEPMYIAVAKDRPDLLARINKAMNVISLRDPYYALRLHAKYFSVSTEQKPVFTEQEEAFIARKPIIRAAYDPTWAPLEYTDPKTGLFSGVVADLFKHITNESGLIFHFEPMPQNQALEMASKGEIDVVCTLTGDYLWNERYQLNATGEYLSTPALLVRPRGAGEIKTIALQQGYWLSQKITQDNPGKRILNYGTVEECFDALLAGKADAAYANTHIVNYLRAEPRYAVLDATPLGNFTGELRIGVSRHADPRLFAILDKCVQYTSTEEMDDLVLKNAIKPRSIRLRDFVAEHPAEVISGIGAVCGLIILLLAYSLAIKSRHSAQIQSLLYRDRLTGLDNLDKFYTECGRLLGGTEHEYALLYGDISQFKIINDNFGFAVGDELLRAYAAILRDSVGQDERCARVSADHFILMLRYHGWEQLAARTKDMAQSLDVWRYAQGMPYKIGTVFGVYLVNAAEKHNIHLMLDLANYARRNAKLTMRGPLVLYDEKMRQDALLQQELSGHLENALEQGELTAWFQPKVDMPSGEINGSEALVRWNHPARGLLMPGSFMPLFERNGAVVQIDIYVFEQVCKALCRWNKQGLPVHPVSCNFSSLHFDRADFPQQLADIAARYEVPHALLEVEITESSIMRNPESACAQIMQLKERGFLIAIDDFGSGYSSLGQIQQIMADVLKLDRSFVQRNILGTREQIVLSNVIRMATELGMSVICEGVETGEQAKILIQLGCRNAQGFFYAKPMPGRDFEQLLQKGARLPV